MARQRIAIISDIHGNRWALEKVLESIDESNVDVIINLGDSLYGPLAPRATAEILMGRNILSIKGNQDRTIVEEPPDFNMNSSLEFTLSDLTSHQLQWLRSQPFSTTVAANSIFLCHGTPESDTEYLIESVISEGVTLKTKTELSSFFNTIPQKIILCGHSHVSRTIHLEDDRWIINPGSVGLQAYTDTLPFPHAMFSGNPLAKYCILDLDSNNQPSAIQHIEVPYDWKSASMAAEAKGRSDWSQWLKSGKNE